MTQQLGSPVVLAEDPGSIPSTDRVAYNPLNLKLQVTWPSDLPGIRDMIHDTHAGQTLIHVKQNLKD